MELEVQVSRTGVEPWGFRLIGGTDFNMPLTVVKVLATTKVLPDSPADLACLRNGDTVSRIQGADAAAMTHDAAKAAVAAAGDTLNLGVTRGLYDPVLDDFDPIYEPLDQEDFDPPSLPTEVFQIKQFTDTPDPEHDPSRSRTGSRGDLSFGELRSCTQSPFVIPTKPYRPFSTEPTPVPPLEDPIILNPDFHDEFAKVDDVVNGFSDGLDGILSGKTRFKLPISEQYDPDGTRLTKKEMTDVTKVEHKLTKEVSNEVKMTSVEERLSKEEKVSKEVTKTSVEERLVQQQQDITFMEKMKHEIDLDKIEMTATSIVNESIEKAVTVAGEIKKEIDLELSAITSETKTILTESKSDKKTDKKESTKEVNELIEMIDKTTDVILKESDISVAKEVSKFESDDKQIVVDERKVSIKQELQETIESGSVRRKSELYDKEIKIADAKVETKSQDQTKVERKQSKIISDQQEAKKVRSSHEEQTSEILTEKKSKTSENYKSDESKRKEAKYSTAKLLAEQRAYTIGLQTIPHIRGTVQSSYHYDLLLKTFFIHLTDVMVALSRFILAEPVFSKPLETKPEVEKDVTNVTKVQQGEVLTKTSKTVVVEDSCVDKRKVERGEVEEKQIHERKVEKVADILKKDIKKVEHQERVQMESVKLDDEETEKKILSGAEMSQLSEKRSDELINKMGGVITEFQTKAGLEEEIVMQRERRSRSRSKIEEEVMNEADPLDWLSKVDKKTQEITEVKTTRSVLESTETKTETKHESKEIKRESKHETRDLTSQNDKNMYIAIVEAHVYTNKNAIMDEIAEISKTASLESVEKTNIAFEANEAMVTERVALQSQTKHEMAEIVDSHEKASAKSEEVIVQEKKDIVQEKDIQESFLEVESQRAAEVEVIEIVEPIVELHEDLVEKAKSIEVKNKMDIQEMQTSEYIDELSVVKEESVETIRSQCVRESKKVQDVRISEEVKKAEIFEEISSKVEDKSIIKDEVKEIIAIKEEAIGVKEIKGEKVVEGLKIDEEMTVIKDSTKTSDVRVEVKDESAHLKVTKEEITEVTENVEMDQEIEVSIKKSVHIEESENKYQSYISENSVQSSEYVQESSFIARSTQDARKQLTLDLDSHQVKKSDSETSIKSTISTPTPSTVPPTPLTDEYVFRLQMPLPKITGPPIPRSPSPEEEDPHIVKKNLVPHIDTEIVEEIVYETPLPTPPEDKTSPPRFTKPGLKGGNMKYIFYKEEIKEIERKSSLLASAIDQTIKSIEEYKEEVGIDNKFDDPVVYNGYAKVIETKVYKDKLDEVNIERQIIQNTENINKIVENRESSEETMRTVNLNGRTATVTVTVENNVDNNAAETNENKMDDSDATVCVEGYRPVPFNPDDAPHLERVEIRIPGPTPTVDPGKAFVAENGEILGTHQGIVDGLDEAVVDEDIAKDLGKPGMTEEKIAELISGESEMLREAHVMGLSRVLRSHMHRDDDDSSVDFKKIKPIVESLKDSEVLKALNEEFMRTQEEKKKEERKWTKFLQKPARPVPKPKFGCPGWTQEEVASPYKPKIVKQPKPKVAPDYKPQDFNTGPLPWEERARNEPPPPPVEPEEPILVPEEEPEFLEAVDPLPESEVPDLEETGIPLPPEKPVEEPKPEEEPEQEQEEPQEKEAEEAKESEEPVVENNSDKDMENRIAEQLMKNVEGMVDPNAPLEQQLQQMRAQLAALAQLPGVIQQTLELVTRQLCQITQQEAQSHQSSTQDRMTLRSAESVDESNENSETIIEEVTEEAKEETQIEEVTENGVETNEEVKEVQVPDVNQEEMEKMKREEQEILEEQRRIEKQKKEMMENMCEQEPQRPQTPHEVAIRYVNELMDELQLDQEARQIKQRPTPRVGNPKPKPVFGPLTPAERPLVLPGGRKWRKPQDAYNEQFIAETLTAQAELIQGKAMGKTYESVHLPYDERVNFMKYEKPPVSLDHLQHSDVFKMIHNMEQEPMRRVDMLTPVIAEADYREKCRSVTPCAARIA